MPGAGERVRRIFRPPLHHGSDLRGIRAIAADIGFGVLFALVFTLIRWGLVPLVGDRSPFSFVFVAVGASTVLAGWRSGLAALVVAQPLAALLFMEPGGTTYRDQGEVLWGLLFSTVAQLLLLALLALYQAEIRRAMAARERADEGRNLLVNELNHRVKNTLAVVQSLASNTFRDDDPASVRAFEGRLQALAGAHDLLTRQNWSSSPVAEIVDLAVAPFHNGSPGRVSYSGPLVSLGAQEAVTLVLGIHELATNASKYGALAVPGGHVAISLDIEPDGAFVLTWQERGGPCVSAPAKSGFGMRLIKSALAKQFDAQVRLDFEREGLVCSIAGRLRQFQPLEEDQGWPGLQAQQ